MSQKKRKQHYVWEHYLSAWTVSGRVWCQIGTKRFATSTENVAHERDFYRLQDMSEVDLRVIEQAIVQPARPHVRELTRRWIPMFTSLFEIRRAYITSGRHDKAIEEQLDIAI